MMITFYKQHTLNLILLMAVNLLIGQQLDRRGLWQSRMGAPNSDIPGAKIISIEEHSPLSKAGLKKDDIILKVNNALIDSPEAYTEMRYNARANKNMIIEVLRNNELIITNAKLNEFPYESHPNIDTYYEEVVNPFGLLQRTIITKPKNTNVPQPAIILIGGLSCSSIEAYPNRGNNWTRVIKDLVQKSGMVVMRIEKPGVGDSEGDCSKSDFYTDIAGFKAAIKLLKSKPYVDTSKIVVYGSSMGSALAPMLANEFNLAGVISDGTFFKTWFEHMLEIQRRILQMSGDTESEIVEKMNTYYIPLYYNMLIKKKTYEEVVQAYPALTEYNTHGKKHMYGRPMVYYHQLQEYDLAGEWEKTTVPIRIMRGTNDWIMSEFDNHMIVDVLKRNGHEDFVLYEYPGLDHWNTIHASAKDSFKGKEGKWEDRISMQIIDWAKEIVGN